MRSSPLCATSCDAPTVHRDRPKTVTSESLIGHRLATVGASMTGLGFSPPHASPLERQWRGVWRLQPDILFVAGSARWRQNTSLYGSLSACSWDQASVQSAGIPPSGVNVVRWDMRRLRTHGTLAPVECQRKTRLPRPTPALQQVTIKYAAILVRDARIASAGGPAHTVTRSTLLAIRCSRVVLTPPSSFLYS
jgi:hypothetical protein